MVKFTVSAIALMAALASAFTQPDTSVGPSPDNTIEAPKKNEVVPAGKAYPITWDVTNGTTVTIYLCVGLSNSCINQATPIADKVKNSGSFSWDVSKSLAPSTQTGFGYGLMIIDDQDNKIYNWSPQFGISNADYSGSSSASGSSTPTSTYSTSAKSTYASATGGYNSTVVQPTGTMTVPTTLHSNTASTTPTGSSSGTGAPAATSTGAAGLVQVGLGAVFGGLVAALAL